MTAPRATAEPPSSSAPARFLPLAALFACVYFIQGIAEPTQGLIAQPVRTLLADWGQSSATIGSFMAIVSLPWSIKPLFGLIADFVPLGRSSRRNWLILMTALTSVTLGWLAWSPPPAGDVRSLLWLLLAPTIGVAFTDVLADSLMVEHGQARGWTGKLQSVQWTALSAATIFAGSAGGWLAQRNQQHLGFLICAVASGCTLLLVAGWRGSRSAARESVPFDHRVKTLLGALARGRFPAAAMFLFLWNFNPFSMTIHQLYMTQELGISEQFYGNTLSVAAVAWTIASAAYGVYCHRFSERTLVHLSILGGVVTTIAYVALQGETSAMVIAAIAGLAYMTGTLIQLDLAARVCPPEVSGTLFALLMSLSNLGVSLAEAAGGWLYEVWTRQWGAHAAFDALVVVGTLTTAACWLLLPWLTPATPKAEPES
ncbi:MAG: MFS transporter [Planctomycetaceae bacterium]